MDRLDDGGHPDAIRIVAEGVGHLQRFGQDRRVAFDQVGQVLHADLAALLGEGVHELHDFRQGRGSVRLEGLGGALDGFVGQGGVRHEL